MGDWVTLGGETPKPVAPMEEEEWVTLGQASGKPPSIFSTESREKYKRQIAKIEVPEERSPEVLAAIEKIKDEIARGETPQILDSPAYAEHLMNRVINRRHPVSGKIQRPIGETDEAVNARITELSQQYSELDLADVIRSEGMEAFPAILALTRSADDAFKLTMGRVPDKESKIRYYSAILGMPEETVRDNFQLVEDRAIYLDQKQLMQNKPRLLEYASDPRNMTVAKDSLKSLAYLESLLVSRHGSYFRKMQASVSSMFSGMLSGAVEGDAALNAGFSDFTSGLAYMVGGGDAQSNPVSRFFKRQSSFSKAQEEFQLDRAQTAMEQQVRLTEEVGGFERFTLDVGTGVAQMGLFIAGGMLNPKAAVFLMGAMEGGHVYGDLREQGVSSKHAFLPSFSVGVINGYLERLQVKNAMKALGLQDTGRSALRNVLQGGFENFIQEATQNVVSEVGLLTGETEIHDRAGFETSDRLSEALDQGLYEGLVAMGTVTILGTPSLAGQTLRYRDSRAGRARFLKAEEVLDDMPMAERSAEDTEKALEQISDDEDGEILVSKVEKYLQTLNPAEAEQLRSDFLTKLSIDEDAYKRAEVAGTEVGFKVRKWLANFSNTDLGKALRNELSFGSIYSVSDTQIMRERIEERIAEVAEIYEELAGKTKKLPHQLKKFRRQLIEVAGHNAEEADHIIDTLTKGGEKFARARGQNFEEWAADLNPTLVINKDGASLTSKEDSFRTVASLSQKDMAALQKQETFDTARAELVTRSQEKIPHPKRDDDTGHHVFPDGTRIVGKKGSKSVQDSEGKTILEGPFKTLADATSAYKTLVAADIAGAIEGLDADFGQAFFQSRRRKVAGTTTVEERGVSFETGVPVTFRSFRMQRDKDATFTRVGDPFLQEIEPAGIYMTFASDTMTDEELANLPGGQVRAVTFLRPLVIEFNTGDSKTSYDKDNWKVNLSKAYGGLPPKELSEALVADGFDGIVTVGQATNSDQRFTSEIVDLSPFAEAADFPPAFSQDTRGMVEFLDGETVISLFKDQKDPSTVLHEIGHIFLKQMQDLVRTGQADEDMIEHYESLVKWAGEDPASDVHFKDVATIEKIIDGWEAYMFEGKAPSVELVGAFKTFAKWMRSVYKSVKQILHGRELTAPVRDAFDFWLASENEIQEAESFYRMTELTSDLFMAELEKDNKAKAARKRLAEAKKAAAEEREAQIQERMQELLALWEEGGGREQILKQAEDTVADKRVYKSIAALRKVGINPLTSNLNDGDLMLLARTHGDDLIQEGSEADLSEIAHRRGYADADTMIGDVAGVPAQAEEVEDLYLRLVQVKLDALRAQAVEDTVQPGDKAVHTEANLELLLADAALMQEKVNKKTTAKQLKAEKKAVKETAYDLLTTLSTLRDVINYKKWANREAKWAAKAFDLASKGQWDDAFHAKQQQILYFAIVQSSFEIREKAKVIERRVTKRPNFQGMTESHAISMQDVLNTWVDSKRFGPIPGSKPNILRFPESGLAKNEEGLEFLLPDFQTIFPEWMRTKDKIEDYRNIKDLTFEQLEILDAALKFLSDRGRQELTVLKELGYKDVDELAKASIKRMETLPDRMAPDTRVVKGKTQKSVGSFFSWLTMPEFMMEEADGAPLLPGGDGVMGPMHKLWHMVRERGAAGDLLKQEMYKGDPEKGIVGINDIAKVLSRERVAIEARFGGSRFLIPGLPVPDALKRSDINITTWDFDMLRDLALNLGNDGNVHALQFSEYGFTDEQLDVVRHGLFSAEAWQAFQDLWNTLNTLYPDFNQAVKDTTFKTLPKEKPQPFTVTTTDGETMEMDGGYYPLVFDTKISPLAAAAEEGQNLEDMARKDAVFRASAQPKSGAANARLRDEHTGEALSKRPPLLGTGSVLFRHIQDVIQYTTHARIMQEVDLLTRHPDWQATFLRKFGRDKYEDLRKSLNYIARPERRFEGDVNRAMNKMKSLFTISILGFKFVTGLKQRLSLSNLASALNQASGKNDGVMWIMKAHQQVGWRSNLYGKQSEEMMEFVHSRSPLMEARALGNYDKDVRDFMKGIRPFKGTISIKGHEIKMGDIQETAFWWVRANDAAAVYPGWMAAFNQAMHDKLNGITDSMTEEEAEKLASQYADTQLAVSQPAGGAADRSAAQRDTGAISVLLIAMTWVMKAGNRSIAAARGFKRGQISAKELGKFYAYEWWLPALAQLAIPAMMYDDEDKPEWYEYFYNPIHDSLAWMPFLGHGMNMGRYGPMKIPALGGVELFARASGNLAKGEWEKSAKNYIRTLLWFTGAPIESPWKDFFKYKKRITGE